MMDLAPKTALVRRNGRELQIPAGAPRSVVLPKVPGGELESRAAFAVRVDQLVDVAPTGSARLGSSEHGFDVFVR